MRAYISQFLGLIALGFGASGLAADLVIFGTDLFGEAIVERLEQQLEQDGHEVELRFEGSLSAREALEAGRADAVLLALPDPAERFPASMLRYPVCSQIAALVVHETNPIRQMELPTLAAIYAASGPVLNWGQLTEDPLWKDRKMALYKADSAAALAAELFSAMALKHEDPKASLRSASSIPDSVAALISDDPGAIVLVDGLSVGKPARYLAIADADARQGYSPTPDNIFFGDYPLRLPFELIVTPDLPTAVLRSLLAALYTDEMGAALQAIGFIPIPKAEQDSLIGSLE